MHDPRAQRRPLVLDPALNPAALFDSTGAPMMPCEPLAERARRHVSDASLRERVKACDEQGEFPTFRLADELADWIAQESGARVVTEPRHDLGAWWNAVDGGKETFWWIHDSKVLAAGPGVEELRTFLSPHHDVIALAELPEWKDALGAWKAAWTAGIVRWNPWRLEESDSPASKVRERIRRASGIDPLAMEEDRIARAQSESEPKPDGELVVEPLDESLIKAARGTLAGLAMRGVESDELLELPFILDEAARSPLRLLRQTERDRLHALVNLGAGRVLRLRLRVFPDDPPKNLAPAHSGEPPPDDDRSRPAFTAADGGDVRLWLEERYESLLEGLAAPARTRRAREAVLSSSSSDDDDMSSFDDYDDSDPPDDDDPSGGI